MLSSCNKVISISICLVLIIFCFYCSSKKESQDPTAEVRQKSSVVAPDTISIKGFSLGMDYSKAREVVLKMFEGADFAKGINPNINVDNTEACVELIRDEPICVQIWKDEDNKLRKIEMSSYAVNHFFKAKDLSAEEFVKEFSINYGLPEMNTAKDELAHYTYWKYESEKGWYVRINDAKYLIYERVPEKQKPNFK